MDFEKMAQIAGGILKDRGIDPENHSFERQLEETVDFYPGGWRGHADFAPRSEIIAKDADDEVVFMFESYEDAHALYEFMTENGLLQPGEVIVRQEEGQNTVHFNPLVVIMKPEVIQAALVFYEEQLEDGYEDAYEAVGEMTDEVLDEATVAGAPKRKRGMGNPFHDKDTGKLSGADQIAAKGGGSWAIGKTKLKLVGKGKDKKGGLLVKFGSTKHPCGRAARADMKDTRCWDGKKGAGFAIAKALGKKVRKEEFSAEDINVIMEMRRKYHSIL